LIFGETFWSFKMHVCLYAIKMHLQQDIWFTFSTSFCQLYYRSPIVVDVYPTHTVLLYITNPCIGLHLLKRPTFYWSQLSIMYQSSMMWGQIPVAWELLLAYYIVLSWHLHQYICSFYCDDQIPYLERKTCLYSYHVLHINIDCLRSKPCRYLKPQMHEESDSTQRWILKYEFGYHI
jgi:hypothetical protein